MTIKGDAHKAILHAALCSSRVLFIIRAATADTAQQLVEAVWEGGGAFVEITLNTPGALDLLKKLSVRVPAGGYLGAGTVRSAADAAAASDCGAQFLVTPVCTPALLTGISKTGRYCIAGALTPTEVFTAWECGTDMVKVFPAASPEYIKTLCGPLDTIDMMAVGGVTPGNAAQFLSAGACAVAVGGSFFSATPSVPQAVRSLLDSCKVIR